LGGILLAPFKSDFRAVRQALLEADNGFFPIRRIDALLQLVPTPQELHAVRQCKETGPYGECTAYFVAVQDVEAIGARLEALRLRESLQREVEAIKGRLRILRIACEELRKSAKLARVFEVLLGMANAINSRRAAGFRLSSLDALLTTKSPHEPTLSLLHFLVRALLEQHPELCNFHNDLETLSRAAPIDIQALVSEVKGIETQLATTQAGLEGVGGGEDCFGERMAGFLHKEAPGTLGELRRELDATSEVATATQAYFGEVQSPLKEMLVTLVNFVKAYKDAEGEMQAKTRSVKGKDAWRGVKAKLPAARAAAP